MSPSRPGPLNTARPRTPSEQWSNPASQDIPAPSADITLTLIRQINTAFEDQRHRTTVYYIKLSVKGERKDRLGLFSPWQLRKKKEKEERGVWREVISWCLKQRWCCLDGVCDGERQAWVRGLPPPPLAPRTRAGCPPETQPLSGPSGHSPVDWGGRTFSQRLTGSRPRGEPGLPGLPARPFSLPVLCSYPQLAKPFSGGLSSLPEASWFPSVRWQW